MLVLLVALILCVLLLGADAVTCFLKSVGKAMLYLASALIAVVVYSNYPEAVMGLVAVLIVTAAWSFREAFLPAEEQVRRQAARNTKRDDRLAERLGVVKNADGSYRTKDSSRTA